MKFILVLAVVAMTATVGCARGVHKQPDLSSIPPSVLHPKKPKPIEAPPAHAAQALSEEEGALTVDGDDDDDLGEVEEEVLGEDALKPFPSARHPEPPREKGRHRSELSVCVEPPPPAPHEFPPHRIW